MTLVLISASERQVIERVPPGDARREHTLRDLIFDHPEIMPVHQLDPGYGRVFTVAKELTVPGVGFIDVVLADENGRLVIVECKLWRNPQARREVVGQILDYARELSRYAYEDLQRQITVATSRRGNALYEMAREAGGTLEEAAFVDRVARDLAAGRFLLLVVGDGITEGTRRIGEYLRDQPGLAFDFGLIELAEYRLSDAAGVARTVIQPRVVAQTVLIERHVIRSDVPGLVIEQVPQPEQVLNAPRSVTRVLPGASSLTPSLPRCGLMIQLNLVRVLAGLAGSACRYPQVSTSISIARRDTASVRRSVSPEPTARQFTPIFWPSARKSMPSLQVPVSKHPNGDRTGPQC